jgi:wobble nucleotide-excising tRNase
MSQALTDIAQQLKDSDKKVQLIYAFNGSGKTRLSRAFKELVAPKQTDVDELEEDQSTRIKILYYNAFTEDLFYWDNDLEADVARKLRIQPNAYTQWALVEQGQDLNAIGHFQRYTDDKLTPRFNPAFSEVTFSFERGDNQQTDNVKISKGEESNFIWSIFHAVLEQVIDVLNVAEPGERETDQFDELEYMFIDDPVSSLDDNHLIQLAVDLAALIKSSDSSLKFIVTTHNPLFYNVLFNELSKAKKYMLTRDANGSYELAEQATDSPFSYHLFLMNELDQAIATGQIHKYHFNFLRNIFEKTSTFLGHKKWADLLPQVEGGGSNPYANRIVNISSHSKHAGDEVRNLTDPEKQMVKLLVDHLRSTYRFWQPEVENA